MQQSRIGFATLALLVFQTTACAGQLYWTDSSSNSINRANLDGTNAETLVTGQANANGIAVDPIGGKVYWTTFASIKSANFDGSGVKALVNTGHTFDFAVDHISGTTAVRCYNRGCCDPESVPGSTRLGNLAGRRCVE